MVLPNVSIALSMPALLSQAAGVSRDSGPRLARYTDRLLPEPAGLQHGGPRYRYAAAAKPLTIAPRRHARAAAYAAPDCGRASAAIETLLGIDSGGLDGSGGSGAQRLSDRYALIALLRFAGETAFSRFIGEEDAAGWLARFRHTTPARAADDLARIRQAMREVFFDEAPSERQRHWNSLPQTVRRDVNLMVAITEAAGRARVAAGDPLDNCSFEQQRESRIYRAVAAALQRAPSDILGFWETSYRMALAQFLREHDAPHNPYFSDRLEVLPSDVRQFIAGIIGGGSAGRPNARYTSDAVYANRRSRDLEAMLYQLWCGEPCEAGMMHPPPLMDMRAAFETALKAEHADSLRLHAMFAAPALSGGQRQPVTDSIYHDGLSMRNAEGCNIDALVARLDDELPDFSHLPQADKQRLVKRKLYQLQENPDYPIGHPFQSMATVLMRLSDRPQANRYVRYSTPLALGQAWEAGNRKWMEDRKFPLAPELLAALHSAGVAGLAVSGLDWYRDIWDNAIIAPLANHPIVDAADASDRKALWQWLQRQAPGWQPAGMYWDKMPAQQYADAVTGTAEVLYQLHVSRFPLLHVSDSWAGVQYVRYDPRISGLPFNMQQAITEVAKEFDIGPFLRERILADNWIATVGRLLARAGYARALALQPPPFYSANIEAYRQLHNSGIGYAQMQMKLSTIVSPHGTDGGERLRRAVYPAFVALMDDARTEQRLLLPGGILLNPHHALEATLVAYRNALPDHPWVRGKAYSMLRQDGSPILPNILRMAIETIVAPMREKASRTPAAVQDRIARFTGALPNIGLLPQLISFMQQKNDNHESVYAMMLVRDAGTAMALGSALDAAAPDLYRQTAALCQAPAGLAAGTRLLRQSSSATALRMLGNAGRRAYRSSEPLRHATPRMAQSGCAALRPESQDIADLWEKIRTTLLPATSAQQLGPRYQLFQLQAANTQVRSEMAESGPPPQDGPAGGFLDLADIDACTRCNGLPLGRHATVIEASDWLLKTGDGKVRDVDRLLSRHVTVTVEEQVWQAWKAVPGTGYDPLAILRRFYNSSEQCRKLLNWHDDHATSGRGIAIVITAGPGPQGSPGPAVPMPMPEQAAGGSRSFIVLPGNVQDLPVIMDERRFASQTIAQATIEGLVKAITNIPAPGNRIDERGAGIWLANRILQQDGEPCLPRVNAAVYTGGDQTRISRNDAARYGAEMEDQYMERLGLAAAIPQQDTYQGRALIKRPTVAAVIDLLTQLDYRRALREEQPGGAISSPAVAAMPAPASPSASAKPQEQDSDAPDAAFALFQASFASRFTFDFGTAAPGRADRGTAIRFLFDCHQGSSLFRLLFDRCKPQIARSWSIFPHGYRDGQNNGSHKLLPAPGIIDASTENRLYQGLFDTQLALSTAETATDTNALPAMDPAEDTGAHARALLPLNPYRRLLDGVVAVLAADTEAAGDDAYMHRGATVWLSDTILWQSGWQVNRRLAAALVPADAAAKLMHLKTLSGSNRRAARAEDRYILDWLELE